VSSSLVIPLFLASAATGVFAALTKRAAVLGVAKPLTTILLFAVVGWPQSRFAWLVDLGIVFSLAGDVALLGDPKKTFLLGLGLFLGAHASYIAAFAGVALAPNAGAGSWWPRVTAVIGMAIVTTLLLRKLWPGAAGLRAPLVGYAGALATMVISAVAAAGAGVPAVAAAGALLFYVADASLALDNFHRPIKNAAVLTLGVYWLGQLGIALAARAYS
jgi:alkenylglycerophosphocholine hydrolase